MLYFTNYITLFIEKDKIEKINYYTAEWISLEKSYNLIEKSRSEERRVGTDVCSSDLYVIFYKLYNFIYRKR